MENIEKATRIIGGPQYLAELEERVQALEKKLAETIIDVARLQAWKDRGAKRE